MEENEIMVTEAEPIEVEVCEAESSGNGLKTVGVLALTAVIGAGLFFGAKKLVKKIKAKKEQKYIETDAVEDTESDDEE